MHDFTELRVSPTLQDRKKELPVLSELGVALPLFNLTIALGLSRGALHSAADVSLHF
jgi:hypothetical protein